MHVSNYQNLVCVMEAAPVGAHALDAITKLTFHLRSYYSRKSSVLRIEYGAKTYENDDNWPTTWCDSGVIPKDAPYV